MGIVQIERTRRTGRLTIVPCESRPAAAGESARRTGDMLASLRLETFELNAAVRQIERETSEGLPLRHRALDAIVAQALYIAAVTRHVQSGIAPGEGDVEGDELHVGVPI
jgi:hypothetical protein